MSKQVYIDSNGNEIQVSGTVNTADMMPMSGNDSTKVSEAIGDLSTLTTTVQSSLVGAVNEVVSTKQKAISRSEQTATTSAYGAINLGISSTTHVVLSACVFSSGSDKYCDLVGTTNGNYYIIVRNTSNGSVVASTSITYEVLYYAK